MNNKLGKHIFGPGLLNKNWGPGLVNTNWEPGPGPGAKQKAGCREIQIPQKDKKLVF